MRSRETRRGFPFAPFMYMNGLHLGKILDAVVGAEAGELSHRLTVGAARIGIADVRAEEGEHPRPHLRPRGPGQGIRYDSWQY
jgi:hypothetical protein